MFEVKDSEESHGPNHARRQESLGDVLGDNNGSSDERTKSLPEEGNETTYRAYPSRFIVLLFFSLAAMQQDQIWLTFGIIGQQTQDYYNVSSVQVDLLAGEIKYVHVIYVGVCTERCVKGVLRIDVCSIFLVIQILELEVFLWCSWTAQ